MLELLKGLIRARYAGDKLAVLEALNIELEVVRYQTRKICAILTVYFMAMFVAKIRAAGRVVRICPA